MIGIIKMIVQKRELSRCTRPWIIERILSNMLHVYLYFSIRIHFRYWLMAIEYFQFVLYFRCSFISITILIYILVHMSILAGQIYYRQVVDRFIIDVYCNMYVPLARVWLHNLYLYFVHFVHTYLRILFFFSHHILTNFNVSNSRNS